VGSVRFIAGLPEKMKQEDVQPYKVEVLRELQNALDDPSRVVRKEAVLARWVFGYLICL
jgi:DNA repair/transcription protein MET18/MMS19